MVFQYQKGAHRKIEGVIIKAFGDKIRSNSFKPEKSGFSLDIGKKLFSIGMVRHWKGLPKEVVNASHLEVFKTTMDEAFSNLI